MAHKKHGNDDPRGNTPKSTGMTARMQWGRKKDTGEVADWAVVSPTTLQALVGVVANQGGAILLGYSRDRGAYRIIVMDDDGKAPVWIPCTTDVDMALEDLVNELMG